MIRSIRSDHPSFKNVTFRTGFNVVLADRTKESTRRDSRNGLGKSTLIEIMHFCMGADARGKQGLQSASLRDWTFTLELCIRGQTLSLSRNTSQTSQIVVRGNVDGWPENGEATIGIRELNRTLGRLLFGLDPNKDGQYRPSFRGLVSQFIRRGREAFSTPFEHHRRQREWEKQINNAFLLGLKWQHAAEWQAIRDMRRDLQTLRKAMRSAVKTGLVGSVGELESRKVRLEAKARKQQEQLQSFRVHPQYAEIEASVNSLTSSIQDLLNANLRDRRLIKLYEESLETIGTPPLEDVVRIYNEALILFPEAVHRRLAEAEEFHQNLVSNRKTFLSMEINVLRTRLQDRESKVEAMTEQRAHLMEILAAHGALEEYSRLQSLHLETENEIMQLNRLIAEHRRLEHETIALRIKQEMLHTRASQEHVERESQRKKAIALFNSNIEALYNVSGSLVINLDSTGYKFHVDIERSGSQGVNNMKVFCYDLMMAQLWAGKNISPGFLVHDSTIFDGVDERQVALALQLAASEAEKRGFQYICTLNSDTLPKAEFAPEFNIDQFVRLRLTDATEDGGLLGIRF